MSTVYTLLKFLHIVGAIGWIGGLVTFTLLSARIAREQNQAVLEALTRLMRINGMTIIGPASGLTLIAGIVMIAVSGLGVPLWVIWGFTAIIVSVVLGVALIGRTSKELREVAAAAKPDEPRLSVLQRRLVVLNTLNVLVLLSAVGAMVFKPAL
jgi:uncharacterized membrane protein